MSTIPQAVLALIGSGPWSYPGQSAVEPHEAVYIKADEPAEPFTFAEVEESLVLLEASPHDDELLRAAEELGIDLSPGSLRAAARRSTGNGSTDRPHAA